MSSIRNYLKDKLEKNWRNETFKKHAIKIIGTIEEIFLGVIAGIIGGIFKVLTNDMWWRTTHLICSKAFDAAPGYISGVTAYAKKWVGCLFISLKLLITEALRVHNISITEEEEENLKNIIFSNDIEYQEPPKTLNLNRDDANNEDDKKLMLTDSVHEAIIISDRIEIFIRESNLEGIVLAKTLIDAGYDDIEMLKVMDDSEIKDLCCALNLTGPRALKLKAAIKRIQ